MSRRITYFLIGSGLVALLDQLSKLAVMDYLTPGGRVEIINGLLALVFWQNTGASFGLLANVPHARIILIIVSLLAVGLIVWLVCGPLGGRPWFLFFLCLITGGALGNLVDRIYLGWVMDFILVHYQGWYWPAFNLADSAITVGGLCAAFYIWRKAPSPPAKTSSKKK